MRRILAGSMGLALGLSPLSGYAQDAPWQPSAPAAARPPAVRLGPPTAALGAPRAVVAPPQGAVQPVSLDLPAPSRVVRAKIDDKVQMPTGPALPGQPPAGTIPLAAPTPLGPTAPAPGVPPGMPTVNGPFLTNPELGGAVISGPIPGGVPLPGNGYAPCATCDPSFAPLPGGMFVPDAHPAGYLLY